MSPFRPASLLAALGSLRPSVAFGCTSTLLAVVLVGACAAPAHAFDAAEYQVTAAARPDRLAAITAMVPEPLRGLVPLLARRAGGASRPKMGGTSLFEPTTMVPLLGARDQVELGLGFGRPAVDRARGDRGGDNVVVIYVGAGW